MSQFLQQQCRMNLQLESLCHIDHMALFIHFKFCAKLNTNKTILYNQISKCLHLFAYIAYIFDDAAISLYSTASYRLWADLDQITQRDWGVM